MVDSFPNGFTILMPKILSGRLLSHKYSLSQQSIISGIGQS
jgi:hypothetical protein